MKRKDFAINFGRIISIHRTLQWKEGFLSWHFANPPQPQASPKSRSRCAAGKHKEGPSIRGSCVTGPTKQVPAPEILHILLREAHPSLRRLWEDPDTGECQHTSTFLRAKHFVQGRPSSTLEIVTTGAHFACKSVKIPSSIRKNHTYTWSHTFSPVLKKRQDIYPQGDRSIN